MESVIALLLFATSVAAHVFASHVDKVPAAAATDRAYPALQAEQSTSASDAHNVPPNPVAKVGVPFGQVHVALQTVSVVRVQLEVVGPWQTLHVLHEVNV